MQTIDCVDYVTNRDPLDYAYSDLSALQKIYGTHDTWVRIFPSYGGKKIKGDIKVLRRDVSSASYAPLSMFEQKAVKDRWVTSNEWAFSTIFAILQSELILPGGGKSLDVLLRVDLFLFDVADQLESKGKIRPFSHPPAVAWLNGHEVLYSEDAREGIKKRLRNKRAKWPGREVDTRLIHHPERFLLPNLPYGELFPSRLPWPSDALDAFVETLEANRAEIIFTIEKQSVDNFYELLYFVDPWNGRAYSSRYANLYPEDSDLGAGPEFLLLNPKLREWFVEEYFRSEGYVSRKLVNSLVTFLASRKIGEPGTGKVTMDDLLAWHRANQPDASPDEKSISSTIEELKNNLSRIPDDDPGFSDSEHLKELRKHLKKISDDETGFRDSDYRSSPNNASARETYRTIRSVDPGQMLDDFEGENPETFRDIDSLTMKNESYMRVLITGPTAQLVLMSLPPGDGAEREVHSEAHRFVQVVSGEATLYWIPGERSRKLVAGENATIPAGTEHEIRNESRGETLKLWTAYLGSPVHEPNLVQETRETDAGGRDGSPTSAAGARLGEKKKEIYAELKRKISIELGKAPRFDVDRVIELLKDVKKDVGKSQMKEEFGNIIESVVDPRVEATNRDLLLIRKAFGAEITAKTETEKKYVRFLKERQTEFERQTEEIKKTYADESATLVTLDSERTLFRTERDAHCPDEAFAIESGYDGDPTLASLRRRWGSDRELTIRIRNETTFASLLVPDPSAIGGRIVDRDDWFDVRTTLVELLSNGHPTARWVGAGPYVMRVNETIDISKLTDPSVDIVNRSATEFFLILLRVDVLVLHVSAHIEGTETPLYLSVPTRAAPVPQIPSVANGMDVISPLFDYRQGEDPIPPYETTSHDRFSASDANLGERPPAARTKGEFLGLFETRGIDWEALFERGNYSGIEEMMDLTGLLPPPELVRSHEMYLAREEGTGKWKLYREKVE